MPIFWALAATCAAIYDLPVDASPASSEILDPGIPAISPREIMESNHLEPVGIQYGTCVGFFSVRLCATLIPACLFIIDRMSVMLILPAFDELFLAIVSPFCVKV